MLVRMMVRTNSGQGGEDVKHEHSAGCGGVEVLVEGAKAAAVALEPTDDGDEVFQERPAGASTSQGAATLADR